MMPAIGALPRFILLKLLLIRHAIRRNMLGKAVVSSKNLAAERKQERKSNGEDSSKRPLEGGDDPASRKAIKKINANENQPKWDPLRAFSDRPKNDDKLENESDSNPLISQLGRELTISCLVLCSRFYYGAIASLNKSFYSLVRSGHLYKIRRAMGIVEHWVYFSCSLLQWEVFNPNHCAWKSLPKMVSNECFMCSDKESLGVGTELLVFGKEIQSHIIYRYSILTNTWTTGMMMNEPRCLFGSASLGEIAILAGGCDLTGKVLSSAELYNSETGTWTMIPSMNTARKMCSGVFMDGKFYVLGGVGAERNVLMSGEVYDLETKTWKEIPNMRPPSGGDGFSATFEAPPLVGVVKNELYAANFGERLLMKYDKENNVWKTMGPMPERVSSMNGWGLAFRACGDWLIIIGGPRAIGETTIEIRGWIPDGGPPQWKLLGTKTSGGFVYNCAIMGC